MKKEWNIIKKIGLMLLLSATLCMSFSFSLLTTYAAERPQGSCNLVEGKTIIITVFVKDGNKKVTNAQKKIDLYNLEMAAEFIMDTAFDCGKESEIITGNDSDHKDLVYEVSCKGAYNKFKADNFSKSINLEKAILKKVPIKKLMKKYKTNSYAYRIIFPKMDFRCYATNFSSNRYIDASYYTTQTSAAATAHELLHNFGAVDLYLEEGASYTDARVKTAKKIEKEYTNPYAIMQHHPHLRDGFITNTVSDLTLCLLGLTDNIDKMQKKYPWIDFTKCTAGVKYYF